MTNKLFMTQPKPDGRIYQGIRIGSGTKRVIRGVCVATYRNNSHDVEKDLGSIFDEKKPFFEWGNKSSGATYLAEAILSNYFQDRDIIRELVLLFRNEFVSMFSFEGWTLTEEIMRAWFTYQHQTLEEME